MREDQKELLGHLVWVANKIAKDEGLDEDGYRIVINNGKNGGKYMIVLS